jgi:hypothetical protein
VFYVDGSVWFRGDFGGAQQSRNTAAVNASDADHQNF